MTPLLHFLRSSPMLAFAGVCLMVGSGPRAAGDPGDVDCSFDPGSGIDGEVRHILALPDGKVLIAGQFQTVRGLARPSLARLNADGSGDPSFDAGHREWRSGLALQPDGKVLVATAEGLTRLHPDGRTDAILPLPITPMCHLDWCFHGIITLVVQPDGRILIGGMLAGTVRSRLARLQGGPPPPPLRLAAADGLIVLSWTETGSPFSLETSSNLAAPESWSPLAVPAVVEAGRLTARLPIAGPDRYHRLRSAAGNR